MRKIFNLSITLFCFIMVSCGDHASCAQQEAEKFICDVTDTVSTLPDNTATCILPANIIGYVTGVLPIVIDPVTCPYSFSFKDLVLSATEIVNNASQVVILKIKAASDTLTIETLVKQQSNLLGELKRLIYQQQDLEMDNVSLRQLLRQFSEGIDNLKTVEDKEKLIQSLQQTVFNMLFQKTEKR